jgi:hypothetical protein
MSAQNHFSVSTALDRERAWALFSDIQSWMNCSDVYEGLKWEGFPWATNSRIVGRVRHNRNERVRYIVQRCEPARLFSFIGHSDASGFASHRTVCFSDLADSGTLIAINYFSVGSPDCAAAGAQFVKWLTERWIEGFARYCDTQASTVNPTVASRQLRSSLN